MKYFEKHKDNRLVKYIQRNNSSEAIEVLMKRHKNLYYKVCHKFHRKNPEIRFEDLLGDIFIVFNSAVSSFDPKKDVKFTTWLYYTSRFHCLNSHKDYNRCITYDHVDIDNLNTKNNRWTDETILKTKETNDYIFDILSQLDDKRIKKIFHMRFVVGGKKNRVMSWNKIAPKLGISISHCINLYKRGKTFLSTKLNSNTICDET